MTASSFYNKRYYPYYGRLHENRGWGGWCPKTVSDRTDYLQVDMGTMLSVCAGDGEDGVPRLYQTEQTIFKSIWVQCCLFVLGMGRMVSQDCIRQNRLSSSRYGYNAVCLCWGWGGWCPKTVSDRTDYLQVDMGTMLSVCAVATQGEKVYHELTTSYKLHLSTNGVTWNVYEETSTAKVCSATICNDFRTAKSPIQWVTKAT